MDEKRCTGPCGKTLPASPEYFNRGGTSKSGLKPRCKECTRKDNQAYLDQPGKREKLNIYSRDRYRNSSEVQEHAHYYYKSVYSQPVKHEQMLASRRSYQASPSGRIRHRAYEHTRRSLKGGVHGKHTAKQIQAQLKRQNCRCYYAACGFSKFPKIEGKYQYHIEHTFPLSRVAGTDIPANDISYLVLACDTCNMSKGSKYPWEWPEGGKLL